MSMGAKTPKMQSLSYVWMGAMMIWVGVIW